MKKPLISIIVPIYNAERYLRPCIESILKQTLEDFELILVNDGSKDSSGNICDEYALKDQRIKVIHKPNSGQSDCRNLAMGAAESDILGFVDSDDWLEPDMFEKLYRLLIDNDADISICEFYYSFANMEKPSCRRGKDLIVYSGTEALGHIIDDKIIQSFLWNKLFRKKVISDPMPVSYVYEDYSTLFKWFAHANKVVRTTEPLYHYRQRSSSTMHFHNPQKNYHYFLAEVERFKYLKRRKLLQDRMREFEVKIVAAGVGEAKEIVRKSDRSKESLRYIDKMKKQFSPYLPVSVKEIGLKKYIRLQTLMKSFNLFKLMMIIGGYSANNKILKNRKYYE